MIKNKSGLLIAGIVFLNGLIDLIAALWQPLTSTELTFVNNWLPFNLFIASRFYSLLFGLLLITLAFNLAKRKKRAFWLTFIISLLSIGIHIFKGLDYKLAFLSFLTTIILWFNKNKYKVKSSQYSLTNLIIKSGLVFLSLFLYVSFSLFLLHLWPSPHSFGYLFHLSWQILTFQQVVLPSHSLYVNSFITSISIIEIILGFLFFSSLFGPVLRKQFNYYYYLPRAEALVKKYGHSPLDLFKLSKDKTFFFHKQQKAFLAYGLNSSVALVLDNPVGEEKAIKETIIDFKKYCYFNDWRLAFFQVNNELLEFYQQLGFKKFKMGDEAIVELDKFKLIGKKGKKLRNIIHKFEKLNYTSKSFQPPFNNKLVSRLRYISNRWLKFNHRQERCFSQGYFSSFYLKRSKVFTVFNNKKQIVAFVNLIEFNSHKVTIDLMRYLDNLPAGIMDFLFLRLFSHLKGENIESCYLGLAPFSGFSIHEQPTPIEKAIHKLLQKSNFYANIQGLKAYKAKFATNWQPRYLIYQRDFDLPFISQAFINLNRL